MTLPILDLPRCPIGPVPFAVAPFDDAVRAVLDSTAQVDSGDAGLAVHFANAYTVALADTDHAYGRLLANPDSVAFTDGVPVAWIGRRGYPAVAGTWDRVYGPDVMEAVLGASGPDGPRHYLLGGSAETLTALGRTIATRWPRATVVGAESPPFRALSSAERDEQDARIRDSGANLVWVGLGTPKQDWEAARLAASLPVIALAVGAAFDFLAGTKPQAPLWMQRSGTEWAFRFASEPRRLAKRYLWGNPRFLLAASRQPGLRKGAGSTPRRKAVVRAPRG